MRFAIIVVLLLALAMPMFAEAPAGGWGVDNTNWDSHDAVTFQTATCVWNGSDWYYTDTDHPDGTVGVPYADISVKLFVELYMVETYQYTSYTFHRLGNIRTDANGTQEGEWIDFIVSGTTESNNALTCGLTKGDPTENLGFLYFRNGVISGATGTDLPIDWFYRYGDGFDFPTEDDGTGWTSVALNGEGEVFIPNIPKCDHWFQFKGKIFLPYHINPGFYSLLIGGCPTPEM